jgi:hypothetical protein
MTQKIRMTFFRGPEYSKGVIFLLLTVHEYIRMTTQEIHSRQ